MYQMKPVNSVELEPRSNKNEPIQKQTEDDTTLRVSQDGELR